MRSGGAAQRLKYLRGAMGCLWSDLSPLTRALGLFLVANTIGFYVVSKLAFGSITSLSVSLIFVEDTIDLVTGQYATFQGDAWRRIVPILDYVEIEPTGRFYEEFFFGQSWRFQYPPVSLLFYQFLRWIGGRAMTSDVALNAMCLPMVLATIFFCGSIFLQSLRRYAPRFSPANGFETLLLWAMIAGFGLTYYPLIISYDMGQTQTYINLLFAAAIWSWMRGGQGAAGALIALICLFKPQLGILLIWAAIRRHWRFCAWFVGVLAIFCLPALWIYGLQNHLDYLKVLSFLSERGESFHHNQSVNGLLHRMLGNGVNLHWRDSLFAPYHPVVYWGTLASSMAIVAGALFWNWRSGFRDGAGGLQDLLIASVSFTIASPIAWQYHYGVLLPVFAAALPMALGSQGNRAFVVTALAVSYFLTGNLFMMTEALADTGWNFLQSAMFLGALLFLLALFSTSQSRGTGSSPADAH